MYCKKCGSKINEGDTFCTNCGTSIHKDIDEKSEKKENNINKNTIKIKLWQAIVGICAIIAILMSVIFINLNREKGPIDDIKKSEQSYIKENEDNAIDENTSYKDNIDEDKKEENNLEKSNIDENNNIKKISMDIYIDSNGNAQVTEEWECSVKTGTECYHPYYNLGNSVISNLVVSNIKRNYTTMNSWNVSAPFNDKAYKCGINKVNNGVELCWGISEYGANTYIIKYNISNFVTQLSDNQMIYWTLIPYDFSNDIGNATIKIYSDTYFKNTIDVWGYGNYGGLCYVNDGAIYMQTDGALDKSEYMTVLVKLPNHTFNTKNKLDNDFNYYYKMAEKGSGKFESENTDANTTQNKNTTSYQNSITPNSNLNKKKSYTYVFTTNGGAILKNTTSDNPYTWFDAVCTNCGTKSKNLLNKSASFSFIGSQSTDTYKTKSLCDSCKKWSDIEITCQRIEK